MKSIIRLNKQAFRKFNEELSKKFDVEQYLRSSHFLIRYVELKRIKYIIEMVGFSPGVLLDIGCGSAFLLRRLNIKNSFGMDLSLHNLISARQNLSDKNNVCLLQSDAESLPFGSARFDVVVCSEVVEHVQNPQVVLSEIARVLKPNGKLIITVPNDNLVNRCKRLFRVLRLDKLLSLKYGGAEEWHLHIFTKQKIKALFYKYGYRIKSLKKSPFSILPLRYIFLCINRSKMP